MTLDDGEPSQGGPSGYDFSFLQADFRHIRAPRRPVNVFALSGFPRWETVASNVLAYFFDPNDERHRLGTTFVDALLTLLDGALVVRRDGCDEAVPFRANAYLGSHEWTVETEHVTGDRSRIDIYLTNEGLDIAVVIENKVDAVVHNPFESYAKGATESYSVVLLVVLAPRRKATQALSERVQRWISAAIVYDELFDAVAVELEHAPDPDARSLDLLRQFIENTSERENHMDSEADAKVLEDFWSALRGKEESFRAFFAALEQVNAVLKRRAEALHNEIALRLEQRGLLQRSTVDVGYEKRGWLREGRVAVVHLRFSLSDGLNIELIIGFRPAKDPQYGLIVKAYGMGRGPSRPFPEYAWVPLGASLSDADADIADKFLAVVNQLLERSQAETPTPRG